MRDVGDRGIPRREFVRSAVAIGGPAALAACLEREQAAMDDGEIDTDGANETDTAVEAGDRPAVPRGDPNALPAGQHVWNEYLVRDTPGNTVPPQHQLVLGLSYEGTVPPTTADRTQVEDAFHSLERAYQWGTGGDAGATFNRGLLTVLGYAPSYFEQVGAVPDDLVRPETVLEQVGEDPTKTDGFGAVAVLTSDVGSVVLGAEQALRGEAETANGVEVDASLEGVFAVSARRTGFAGQGLPAEKLDHEDVPERAPLSMGFKSGFTDSLPSEDGVTLTSGPLAGGTTLAVSRLRLDLDRWYDQDHEERVAGMFCPAHDPDAVGPAGTGLGADSGVRPDDVDRIPDDAADHDRLGHSQKVARARDDDFRPQMLRRSEGFATDAPEHTGFNFTSVQRDFDAFVEARRAMNVEEYDVDVPAGNHGIVDYVETVDRGTYLVPPRDRRALPVVEG